MIKMADEQKKFKYKGKTLEELKLMSNEEFFLLLPSDLRRKTKRGFTQPEQILLKKIRSKERNIKTHAREMIVLPEMVGEKISVYNGKSFVQLTLVEETLGLRLGELAPSKKIGVTHSGSGAKKTEVRK